LGGIAFVPGDTDQNRDLAPGRIGADGRGSRTSTAFIVILPAA
jgi:hypothetical protein